MHNGYPGGGEGYSNIFIYMYTKARPILGDLKFWISIFIHYYYYLFFGGEVGGGVQKIESLWRMQILWILFLGSSQNRLFFGFIFMHLQVFFKFNV